MKSLMNEIDEIYVLYLLSDKNISKLLQITNKSSATIRKYITIKESLDFSLFPFLNKKGSEKLTLDVALYLCKQILNPSIQETIYPEIQFLRSKDKKKYIQETTMCLLCADNCNCMDTFPCCGKFICELCMITIFETMITSITIELPKCPFCNIYLSPSFIKKYILTKDSNLFSKREPWMNKSPYFKKSSLYDKYHLTYYLKNICKIIKEIINIIEYHYEMNEILPKSDRLLQMKQELTSLLEERNIRNFSKIKGLRKDIRNVQEEIELATGEKWGSRNTIMVIIDDTNIQKLYPLITKNTIFGLCYQCNKIQKNIPIMDKLRFSQIKKNYKLCTLERQCANQENELFEAKPEMFVCNDCTDGTFKKCPHCGVKTLKPDGCNYIYCGDHRWCWICEERLENSNGGHNEHYYTGPGTSPYTNRCRKSMNMTTKPWFILDTCDCSHCIANEGLPLCRTLECMNRTYYLDDNKPSKYCYECH